MGSRDSPFRHRPHNYITLGKVLQRWRHELGRKGLLDEEPKSGPRAFNIASLAVAVEIATSGTVFIDYVI